MSFCRSGLVSFATAWLACVALPGAAFAGSPALSTKPYVVKIHADWCKACQSLEPTWAALERELGDEAVLVEFDVTNGEAARRSKAEAERLGLAELFLDYRRSTGTVVVVDAAGDTVAVLRAEPDVTAYQDAVARARATD